jgi:hypothetical protein
MNSQRDPDEDRRRLTGGPEEMFGRACTNPLQLEAAAREELNSRAGRRLSDEEWAATRRGLIAFIRILRGWDRPKMDDRNGKVVGLAEDYPKAA